MFIPLKFPQVSQCLRIAWVKLSSVLKAWHPSVLAPGRKSSRLAVSPHQSSRPFSALTRKHSWAHLNEPCQQCCLGNRLLVYGFRSLPFSRSKGLRPCIITEGTEPAPAPWVRPVRTCSTEAVISPSSATRPRTMWSSLRKIWPQVRSPGSGEAQEVVSYDFPVVIKWWCCWESVQSMLINID